MYQSRQFRLTLSWSSWDELTVMGAKTAEDEEGETDEIFGGKIGTKTRTPDRRYFST